MGVKELMRVIQDHAPSAIDEVQANDLKGLRIAVDAPILLNQLINVGDHTTKSLLQNLFCRVVNLISNGLEPIFVFDGSPPNLKLKELAKRKKNRAETQFKVTSEQILKAEKMLSLLGVPYIIAPGEADPQCAYMVKKRLCYAVASEDMDCLPFGASVMLRGLKFSAGHETATRIQLNKVHEQMELSHQEFIDLCLLLGTDYNETIPGIGRVKAVKLLYTYKSIEGILHSKEYPNKFQPTGEWEQQIYDARNQLAQPLIRDVRPLELHRKPANIIQLRKFLCEDHGISASLFNKKIRLLNPETNHRIQQGAPGLCNLVASFLRSYLHPTTTRVNRRDMEKSFKKFYKGTTFNFQDVLVFCRQRRFAFFLGSDVVFKPRYIQMETGHGEPQIWILSSPLQPGGSFYACKVCQRGLSTLQGLRTHQLSESHLQEVDDLTCSSDPRSGLYVCNLQACNLSFIHADDLRQHLTHEEFSEISLDDDEEEEEEDDSLWCDLCGVHTTSTINMEQHVKGKKHQLKSLRQFYRLTRENLTANKCAARIDFVEGQEDTCVMSVDGAKGRDSTVQLYVDNLSNRSCLRLKEFTVYSDVSVSISPRLPVDIDPSDKCRISVNIRPKCWGRIRVPILFTFTREKQKFYMCREVLICSVSKPEIFQELEPCAPFQKKKREDLSYRKIIRNDTKGGLDNNYELEMTLRLEKYDVPQSIIQAVRSLRSSGENAVGKWQDIVQELNLRRLEYSNYSVFFNNLIYLEEEQQRKDIAHYTMHNVSIHKDSRTGFFRLTVPGLAENRPSVLKGDVVYVTQVPSNGNKYEGYVHNVNLSELYIGFHRSFSAKYVENMKFTVEFTINRLTIQLQHRAVTWAGEPGATNLERVLFPHSRQRLTPLFDPQGTQLKFLNRKIEENREQKTAVTHIVCGTSRPAPYLIYGPPGTGKTFTLVEAIKQVCRHCSGCRILACAPQNAAADLMAARLLEHISKDAMLRLHALSRKYGDVNEQVQEVSNYRSKSGVISHVVRHGLSGQAKRGDMDVYYPSKAHLASKQVIVSTLVTSGRLVSAEMGSHFTHIFIDEAGHATEPETVIPLAGLLDVNMKSGGQVVLAGDPKQLGPIIRSYLASQHGLEKSILERLMSMDVYKTDEEGKFNPDYVTKLVKSFRSHPDIMEVPNACFYDNELQACADRMQRERFCNWEGLPTKNFPLIFHGIVGAEEQEGNSPSWFNRYEVIEVITYVEKLFDCKNPKVKPESIGIISPYHQQANKIIKGLKALELKSRGRTRGYADIKVGPVECFQGDERDIIIISTVRSQDMYLTHDKDFNLGFVRTPKRFNVAVTRTKALLIVIGNPNILRKDDHWRRLLEFIEEGGGCVGLSPSNAELDEDVDLDNLSQKFESIRLQDAGGEEVNPDLLVGDQEWRRNE